MAKGQTGKPKLFSWLGGVPLNYDGFSMPEDKRHRVQVKCWVALPTKAAFKRLTNSSESFMPYVGIDDNPTARIQNVGAQLALANPGVVYMHDEFNHAPGEDVWIVHPFNGNSYPGQG